MFGKHRGNTTPTADEANADCEAAPSPSKSRRPMLRTLEPRMVFDAAVAATAEHTVAASPPHPPPTGEAAHPPVSDLAWMHLAESLKPAPPQPIDKSAVAEGLAAIKPIAAETVATTTQGAETVPKAPEVTRKTGEAAEHISAVVDKVAERLEATEVSMREEVDKSLTAVLEKAPASLHPDTANAGERSLTDAPEQHHSEAGPKTTAAPSDVPIAHADMKAVHPGTMDPTLARELDRQVEAPLTAAPIDRAEVWIGAHAATEFASKAAPPPGHGEPPQVHAGETIVQSSIHWPALHAPSDRSGAAGADGATDGATEHHLPPASDRVATDPRTADTSNAAAAADATEAAQKEVYFIWDNVADWQQIVASLGPSAKVYVLDSSKDGVEQIAAILKGQSNISAIHIISHGSEGSLTLGTAVLDADSMQGEYRDELEEIGQALSQDGDILIYGCDFGAGANGLEAAVILAGITHADVAASTDATGAAALGGDWVLEEQTGKIETKVFTDQNYEYLLANPTIDLNGSQIGNNFTTTYTEQATAVSIVATGAIDGATVTDADNDLQSITIVASAAPNGNAEHLNFAGTAIGLGSDSTTTVAIAGTTYRIVYTAATRTFVITNSAGGAIPSDGITNTLLRSITYDNSADSPTNGGANLDRVFTFSAADSAGGISPDRTATINIAAVNDPPVDADETNTVSEDTTLTVPASSGLLANATDADGDPLTITGYTIADVLGTQAVGSAVAIPGVGAITINADGSYSFAPAANYSGAIPVVTYTVSDSAGGTDTSTLTLTMVSANDAPTGTDNIATINEDTAYTFSAASFGFADPNDAPANAFEAAIITTLPPTSQGTLLLSGVAVTAGQRIAVADIPNLTFQPAADVNGTGVGSFTFQVVDNGGTANGGQDTDQSPNTFAFSIAAVNDQPVAADDTATTPEDTTLNGNVLANDTDVDNDVLTVTQFSALNVTATAGQTGTIPGVGQITINADGTYSFIPVANFNGPVPTITYVISDSHGGTDTATLNITVVSVNDPPIDGNETNTVVEDTTLTVVDGATGDLLNNASDSDGGTLTITDYTIPGANGGNPITAGTATLIDGVGTVTINANGSYSFVPVANYDGPIPVITYTVFDGQGGTDTSTLILTMTPVNDPPVGVDDAATTPENTPVSGNVLGNDTDVDNTTLTVTFFSINGTTFGAGTTASIAGVGSLVINSDGSYTFSPALNYDGTVPPATYTVSDGALTDTAILTITITPQNEPPAAGDDTGTTPEDTTLSVPASAGLLSNDTDVDGDPLTITGFTVPGDPAVHAPGSTATIANVGDLTINADGSYTFAPAPNYNGPVPVATYTVSDGNGGTDQGTLSLNVTPVNDPPVAVDDTGTTPEDTSLNGNVLGNDTDVDGDTTTVIGFTVNGNTFIAGATATLPEGTITVNADGTYTLVPAANYTGPVPVITYTVSDGHGGTDTATLSLDVVPVNDPPVANDDNASTPQDTTLNGNVVDNDGDVDGDTIVVTEYTIPGVNGGNPIPAGTATPIPGVGTITVNPDGSYIFVPAPGYVGPVPEVDYTISDGNGGTDQGALNINVVPIDGAGANDDVATTPEDTTLTGNVVSNDVGPNGDPISVSDFTVNGTTYQPGNTAHLAQGDLTIGSDGSYTFVPAPDYFGPVPIVTYTATNGTASDTATLTISVTPVDDPPVAVDDTGTTTEDTTLTGNVLTNDTDIDSAALTVTEFTVNGITATAGQTGTIPGVGQITINANGSYTFVPAANYDGPVPVVAYTLSDGTLTDTATLTITITSVNDAPVAVNDTGTTPEDTTLTIPAASGLLSNDTDVDNTTLTVTGFEVGIDTFNAGETATIAGVGRLTINADGSYSFVPAANYNGPVPATTYTVSDGTLTATATLTITVTPVNDAPIANDDVATLPEDTTLTVPAASGLLSNDGDVDSATLTVQGFEVSGVLFGAGTTANIPGVGALTIQADGSYTFTPVLNFNGLVPSVTYRVSDGNGGSATAVLTITVTPVNDAPVDGDETNSVVEDTTLSVPAASGLLNNATDVDGTDTLTITDYTVPGLNGGNPIAAGAATLIPDVGTITVNADGSYSFAPANDYTGPVPVISYTVSDGAGGTDTSTLSLTVTPVNDPPVAVNDLVSTPEDTTLTGNVLGNDVDVDGDTLRVDLYQVTGLGGFLPGAPAVIPSVGTLTINADGSYTFVPVANYNGPVPTATYRIVDPSGLQATADLIIVVTPVNDPPVDGNETSSVTEDTTLIVSAANGLLNNTTDIDGGPPSVVGYTVAGQTGSIGASHLIAGVGTITINADGSYSFAPEANYVGAIPIITYTVSDGRGGTDISTLTLTMVPVNDPPVASDDAATTPEDTAITGNVLANDTDIDGDTLSVTQFVVSGTTYNAGDTATIAGVGTLTIGADGSATFVPATDYNGPVPITTYTISDGHGGTDTATVTITVAPVNDPPIANDDSATTPEDTTLTGNVLTNDTDIDGDALSVTQFVVDGATYNAGETATITGVGTLTIGANGSYAFVPAADYNGPVPVATYTVSDGTLTDAADLTITVTPVNDPPVAGDDTGTTPEDTTLTGNVLTNDTDIDGDALSVTQFVVNGTTYNAGETATITGVGTLTIGTNGSYTFVPVADYNGPVPIASYTVSDGALTDTATLTITVTPVNDPPVASDDTGITPEDTTLTGTVLVNDRDIDGDTLFVTQFVAGGTTNVADQTAIIADIGALTIRANGSYTFVPALNYNGPVPTATYTVSDGHGGTDTATLTITVTPVNDPPRPDPDRGSLPPQSSIDGLPVIPVDVALHFVDVDGDPLTYSARGLPPGLSIDPATGIIHGTLPNDASQSSPYLVVVTATDPSGARGSEIFIWTVVNPAPIARDDAASVPEDTALTGIVLANDLDPDGDPITVTKFEFGGKTYAAGQTATISGIGSLVINADGSYAFTPSLNFNGPVPAATYTLADGNGGFDTAALMITVTPVNDPPVPVDDRASGNEDTPITGNVLPNDSDPDGDSLAVTGFTVEGDTTGYLPGDTASIPSVGTISLAAAGNFTFIPAPNYDGPVPSITYRVSDGHGGTGQATLVITIKPVDDFVPTPDNNLPDLPESSDYSYHPDNVDGAVVEAVRGLDSLNDIATLSERPIDVRVDSEHPPIRFALNPFLGGSSTIVIDLPAGGDEKIQIEAIKHAGLIYLQITEETDGHGGSTVLSYRLREAEDSTAAAWLSQPGPHTFVGYPDAGMGTVDLILSVVQKDGRVIDCRLKLDTVTGHLSQPPAPQDHGFEGRLAPMFSEQMNRSSPSQLLHLVEKALGFL